MTFPSATRKNHERFCIIEKWVQRTTASGKTGTHHVNYELPLPGTSTWPLVGTFSWPRTNMWSHILRDQLDVTADEFWTCVHDRVTPERGGVAESPVEAIARMVEQFNADFP